MKLIFLSNGTENEHLWSTGWSYRGIRLEMLINNTDILSGYSAGLSSLRNANQTYLTQISLHFLHFVDRASCYDSWYLTKVTHNSLLCIYFYL
jgi:hypothetical protein